MSQTTALDGELADVQNHPDGGYYIGSRHFDEMPDLNPDLRCCLCGAAEEYDAAADEFLRVLYGNGSDIVCGPCLESRRRD